MVDNYKTGDKFILETSKASSNYHSVKGSDNFVVNNRFLSYLEPLDMTVEETWEIALKLFEYSDDLWEIFGFNEANQYMSIYYVLDNFTPQHVKNKIEEYEKSKKEIKVGNVVIDVNTNKQYVVTGIREEGDSTQYICMNNVGLTISVKSDILIQTDKHINIESILDQIEDK